MRIRSIGWKRGICVMAWLASASAVQAHDLAPWLIPTVGAVAGAVVGHHIGGDTGAVVGAGVGAAVGVVVSDRSHPRKATGPLWEDEPKRKVKQHKNRHHRSHREDD